jgi:hypothetical protein
VRVNGGDDRALVAEIDLDLAEVLALLEQVRGVRMAQGMDVRRFGDAGGQEGQAEGALERGAGHRLGCGARPASAVPLGGKEQDRMAVRFPLFAQELQRALGERDVAVGIALASADVQEHALGIDIANLEAQAFAQAQAAGVNGAEANAMIQGGDGGQKAAHLGGGEHNREFKLGIGASQFQLMRPDPAERFLPEQFNGADGLGAGLAGNLFGGLEMNAVLADLLRRNQLGRPAVELPKLADTGVVGLFTARAQGQERQIIREGF